MTQPDGPMAINGLNDVFICFPPYIYCRLVYILFHFWNFDSFLRWAAIAHNSSP
jgi:hypothetical protein